MKIASKSHTAPSVRKDEPSSSSSPVREPARGAKPAAVHYFRKDEMIRGGDARAKLGVDLGQMQPAALASKGGVPGWVATPYPETEQERTKELERIEGMLAEKADWGEAEAGVLKQIEIQGVSPIDLWHGSHVVVNDGGALYDQWSQMAQAQARTSSHYSDVEGQQYELDFPPHGALLFGKDADGNTWFQMENHGGSFDPKNPRDYFDGAAHLFDYGVHKLSGNMNVGPFGLSPHSEKEGKQLEVNYVPGT